MIASTWPTVITVGRAKPVQKLAMHGRSHRRRLPTREIDLATPSHRRTGAADRIGLVEILDRIGEWCGIYGAGFAEGLPSRARDSVSCAKDRMRLPHTLAQFAERVEGQ